MKQLFTNAIISGSSYALMAMGFSLIYSAARNFHLAHAATYTIAAYLCYLFATKLGFSALIVFTLAILGACALGAAMEILIYRPLRERTAFYANSIVASLGALVIIQNVLSVLFGDTSKAIVRDSSLLIVPYLGVSTSQIRLLQLLISLICCTSILAIIKKTTFGRNVRAIASDPTLAQIYGINRNDIIIKTMIIGSAFAAVAAGFQAFDTSIYPTMGFEPLFIAVVAMIIGGVDNLVGAMFGAYFISLLQNLAVWLFPSQWQNTFVYSILIMMLVIKPNGLLRGSRRGSRI